jgi:hypothetical protein
MTGSGSVSVEFRTSCVDADGILLVAELDDFLNDKNCFVYGDRIFFRVYHSEGTISITSSAGSISLVGANYNRLLAETIPFANTNEASLSKLIDSIQTCTWYGRDLGSILKTGNTSIKSTTSGVGVAYVSYMTKYDLYSITLGTQPYDSFPVIAYIEAS